MDPLMQAAVTTEIFGLLFAVSLWGYWKERQEHWLLKERDNGLVDVIVEHALAPTVSANTSLVTAERTETMQCAREAVLSASRS